MFDKFFWNYLPGFTSYNKPDYDSGNSFLPFVGSTFRPPEVLGLVNRKEYSPSFTPPEEVEISGKTFPGIPLTLNDMCRLPYWEDSELYLYGGFITDGPVHIEVDVAIHRSESIDQSIPASTQSPNKQVYYGPIIWSKRIVLSGSGFLSFNEVVDLDSNSLVLPRYWFYEYLVPDASVVLAGYTADATKTTRMLSKKIDGLDIRMSIVSGRTSLQHSSSKSFLWARCIPPSLQNSGDFGPLDLVTNSRIRGVDAVWSGRLIVLAPESAVSATVSHYRWTEPSSPGPLSWKYGAVSSVEGDKAIVIPYLYNTAGSVNFVDKQYLDDANTDVVRPLRASSYTGWYAASGSSPLTAATPQGITWTWSNPHSNPIWDNAPAIMKRKMLAFEATHYNSISHPSTYSYVPAKTFNITYP